LISSPAAVARLRAARGFVFDMDGTLVLSDAGHQSVRSLPGAADTINGLAGMGLPFSVLTNGTLKPPAELAALLRGAGLPVPDTRMQTPASIAAAYFARRGVARVMVIGTRGTVVPFVEAGLTVLGTDRRAEVDAVFVGWSRDFTMDDLEIACHAVWGGARLFTASVNAFFATADGRAIGTSRAISAMITSVTGKRPGVLGKPSREALSSAERLIGVPADRIVVVGDDPGLEIAMARRGGALSVLVTTGIAGREVLYALPESRRPDLVVANVGEMWRLYRGADATSTSIPGAEL
jgi:4-nitrophenyl phosphatase